MEISLADKKALVTGGSRGIGKEIVKTLVQAGAQVTVLCILKDALEMLKKEIPSVTIIHHDLSDWKKTEILLNSLPPMDLLVNNAGICDSQAIGSVTEENFDRVFAINVKAVINVSQVMSKKMIESGIKGSIVNLASYTSQKIFPETVTYCTSKIAVDHITRALAKDLAPHGIRVNAVNPAVVNTDMGKQFSRIVDTGKVEKMPLNNRPIQPEEVAKPILFLLSDWASMISGETIRIDGCLFHE